MRRHEAMQGLQESQRVLETIRRVIARVGAARSTIEDLRSRIEGVLSDGRLSAQGQEEGVKEILGDGRPAVEAELYAARVAVDDGVFQVERHLSELTDVPPEVLAARATV